MTQDTYWNTRYQQGKSSGAGSIGLLGAWKYTQLTELVPIDTTFILDYGCGDLSFWETNQGLPPYYVGYDASAVIIQKNKSKYPTKNFITTKPLIRADVVVCFDVLFHIMTEQSFITILHELTHLAREYLLIYTWKINPLAPRIKDNYQYFRPLEHYMTYLQPLQLVSVTQSPFDSIGALYIFKR